MEIVIFVVLILCSLKRHIYILTFFILFICSFRSNATIREQIIQREKPQRVDTILDNLILFAPLYKNIVEEYNANLYIKGKMNVIKRNNLIHIVPSAFKLERKVKEYMMESFNEIHFTAPNIYDQKVKAIRGTIPRYRGIPDDMLQYLRMNIYSPTLLYDKILSPLASNSRSYYSFRIDSVTGNGDNLLYKIRITPRNKSYQLISGYMVVSSQLWTVRQMYMEGQSGVMKFNMKVEMGVRGEEAFLPVKHEMNFFFRFLGNRIDGSYTASSVYSKVKISEIKKIKKEKKRYDLSDSFTLTCDTSSLFTDSAHFARIRPIPLNDKEKIIYADYALRHDTMEINKNFQISSREFWGQTGDALLSNYTVNLSRFGSVRCSPIINPFLLSYSHSDGFSYRQDFKYNRLFAGDRLLRIVPKVGYSFKRKEIYWSVNSDFDYWPGKRASIHMSFGNGNRIYSSEILDDLKAIPDSVFDFDYIHLDYFRDFYFQLTHSVEVTNGLTISAGFTTHKRTAIEKSRFVLIKPPTIGQIEQLNQFRNSYISFAPRLHVDWTPGQYYYMSGKRKVNLHSDYPTFSADYERGIKGVGDSSGEYERIEFDLQHQIKLGFMRKIFYRAGCGFFTNQSQQYFVDFANFTKNNLPTGWDDEIGGVFQLLDSRWYNSSNKYIRAHFTYEAPFLTLRHLAKYTRSVLSERLYFNALCVPHLKPYLEFGYGVGTHVFDAGVFVSNTNGKFSQAGFKFTFELFNK